jgi:hypothetical protein
MIEKGEAPFPGAGGSRLVTRALYGLGSVSIFLIVPSGDRIDDRTPGGPDHSEARFHDGTRYGNGGRDDLGTARETEESEEKDRGIVYVFHGEIVAKALLPRVLREGRVSF